MDDYKIDLEILLLSYYIRYDRLIEMTTASLSDIQGNTVDVYIDLYDYLKPIYTKDIYANKRFLIVSSIINLAAHIRGFFRTRHRLYTRIYLVYGESTTNQHKIFYPSFGDDSFRQTINYQKNNEFIKSQLQLLKILCGYIPDVYYIERKSDFSMFTFDNIYKNPTLPTVIFTKSKYVYQIPAMLPNAKIFRPKKTKDGDVSYIVSKPYVYGNIYNKIADIHTLDRLSKINPELCGIMLTLTGLPSFGVNSIFNIRTASKMLYDAIEQGRILNGYTSDIDYIYNNISGIENKIDPVTFKYRFNAIDLLYQYRIYNSTAEARDISWQINLDDPKTVQDINNRYFVDNPLDLNSL